VLIILLVLWLSGTMAPGMLRWAVSPFDAMALPALRLRLDDRVALTVCRHVTAVTPAGPQSCTSAPIGRGTFSSVCPATAALATR
jgi:hypothetical protein